MLKLEATTKNEELILNYLNTNASELLKEKINRGTKTLSQCWNYINSEARKLAVNGCACIQDSTVFGWAVHFFEEDSIKGTVESKRVETVKPEAKPKVEKKATVEDNQLNLFDMLG